MKNGTLMVHDKCEANTHGNVKDRFSVFFLLFIN